MSQVSTGTVSAIPSPNKQTAAKRKGKTAAKQTAATTAGTVQPQTKKGKQLTNCKQCNGNLKLWKDKGETEGKLTCQDCGWRIGDRVKKQSAKTADRRAAETAKDNATKAKNKLRKANAVTIEPQRNYGLDKDQIAAFKAEKSFNAYRPSSSYFYVVESLHSLGVGKFHSGADLIAEYVKTADRDALKNFKQKEARNEATGLEWKAKILQNAYVTTRADYGKRMRDIGYEVRCERRDGIQFFGLFKLSNGKK